MWSEGFIIPIYKKGDNNLPENYRGVTLLSTLGKLFSKILNTRLNNWAENYHVYIDAQAGFRSKMGTVDNIFVLQSIINHIISENKRLFVCFVDFTKAFDFIVRDNLWLKLIKLGVRGKVMKVLKSMYTNVKSRIKLSNTLSETFMCSLGVRQGDSLSPFLFSMYINDLEDTFILKGFKGIDLGTLKLFLLLYADDIAIISETKEDLQNGLNILKDYCDEWKLKLNVNKTKIMVFKKGGRNQQNLRFLYGNTEIEIVNKFTYLGIVFTVGGSFSKTFEALSGQALKAIFKLNSYMQNFPNISVSHTLDLFDKLITPILSYGCEVWGFMEAKKIENIHLKFCKNLLGVRPQTQNNFVYGELGREQLIQLRMIRILKFWFKILKSEQHLYIKKVYNMMIFNIEQKPNYKCWANSIKQLLQRLGFYHVWVNQGVGNEILFLNLVKQRLKDNYMQNWTESLRNSSRASLYILFSNFDFKLYLEQINIQKFRIALTRFRVSAHRLLIETGRWHKPNKIPRNERKCIICNKLEDEYHFLLECTLYCEIRTKYLPKYYWKRPNIPKFIELMSNESTTIIRKLSTFIYKAFEIRTPIYFS
jgi:hypothetical protein